MSKDLRRIYIKNKISNNYSLVIFSIYSNTHNSLYKITIHLDLAFTLIFFEQKTTVTS